MRSGQKLKKRLTVDYKKHNLQTLPSLHLVITVSKKQSKAWVKYKKKK